MTVILPRKWEMDARRFASKVRIVCPTLTFEAELMHAHSTVKKKGREYLPSRKTSLGENLEL